MVVLLYSYHKPVKKILYFILFFYIIILIAGFMEGFSKAAVYLIALPLAALLGWLSNRIKPVLYVILGVLLIFLSTYYLLPNSIFYFSNNKGAYVNEEFSFPVLYDRDQEEAIFDKNKMYVLDFWHTRCGPCYKKFPEFERVSEMYKNDSGIEFYAVNIKNNMDSFERALEIIDTLNYSFKHLFALDKSDDVVKELNIRIYPTLLIINRGEVVYRGSYVSEKNVIVHPTLDKQIEALKNNL